MSLERPQVANLVVFKICHATLRQLFLHCSCVNDLHVLTSSIFLRSEGQHSRETSKSKMLIT